ncbi:hypothetical protein [Goodfellowiella coeruleoviolacea]|uniref:hypothetical protein n=1 Tax=Goodfellowiella coeruleoviolacea TaxID=334858 RepID=UPI0020A36B8F|nr:hypothetical protein [Goodfellowiella coeruleoviolacea]
MGADWWRWTCGSAVGGGWSGEVSGIVGRRNITRLENQESQNDEFLPEVSADFLKCPLEKVTIVVTEWLSHYE